MSLELAQRLDAEERQDRERRLAQVQADVELIRMLSEHPQA
jgi:hypothetical protein